MDEQDNNLTVDNDENNNEDENENNEKKKINILPLDPPDKICIM